MIGSSKEYQDESACDADRVDDRRTTGVAATGPGADEQPAGGATRPDRVAGSGGSAEHRHRGGAGDCPAYRPAVARPLCRQSAGRTGGPAASPAAARVQLRTTSPDPGGGVPIAGRVGLVGPDALVGARSGAVSE